MKNLFLALLLICSACAGTPATSDAYADGGAYDDSPKQSLDGKSSTDGSNDSCLCEEGVVGPQGERGEQGERGLPGADGATGPQGPQGLRGLPGATGAAGAAGPQGERGLTGATGPQGIQGIQGPAGARGLTGERGPQGERGLTGPAGTPGAAGAPGIPGPVGPRGLGMHWVDAYDRILPIVGVSEPVYIMPGSENQWRVNPMTGDLTPRVIPSPYMATLQNPGSTQPYSTYRRLYAEPNCQGANWFVFSDAMMLRPSEVIQLTYQGSWPEQPIVYTFVISENVPAQASDLPPKVYSSFNGKECNNNGASGGPPDGSSSLHYINGAYLTVPATPAVGASGTYGTPPYRLVGDFF